MFIVLSVRNLAIAIGVIIHKNIEDKNIQEQNEAARNLLMKKSDSLKMGINYLIVKQDSVKLLLEKFGIRPDFKNPEVYLNVNNNFNQFLTNAVTIRNEQNVKLSNFSPRETVPKPDTSPPPRPNIVTSEMEGSSCTDKRQNYQYATVCFDNKTGQNLIMNSYVGFLTSSSFERQTIPANRITCMGKLVIDIIDGVPERDYSFYFTKEDGTEFKTPYRVTLKKCLKHTINLDKDNLGL